MGIHNSSRTRVTPVFDSLFERDPTGRSWLLPLMRLGSRAASVRLPTDAMLLPDHQRTWGPNERRLNAPTPLLRWLVQNASPPTSDALWGGKRARSYREKLVGRDPDTVRIALEKLELSVPRRAWYVLEGQSQPDAYLETTEFILVVEGKRTEREATSTTTWMPKRSQMLRHMDAASWATSGAKHVYGMMVVEGEGGRDAVMPSEYWIGESDAQVLEATLDCSLPHRAQPERHAMANGFLGVTTWQGVCAAFSLPCPPTNDAA